VEEANQVRYALLVCLQFPNLVALNPQPLLRLHHTLHAQLSSTTAKEYWRDRRLNVHSDIHGGQTVLRCLMSAGPGTYNRFSARDDVAAAAAAAVQADPAPDAAGMLPNRGPSFQCEYCNCQPLNDWPALRSHYSKEHKDLHMAAKAARKTQKEQNQQAARHGVKRRHSNVLHFQPPAHPPRKDKGLSGHVWKKKKQVLSRSLSLLLLRGFLAIRVVTMCWFSMGRTGESKKRLQQPRRNFCV